MIADQKLSVAEVARRPDVSETPLRAWRKAVLAGGGTAFPGHGNPTPADDELRRLSKEASFDLYLVKPVDPAKILADLAAALARRPVTRPTESPTLSAPRPP
jgi:transposase-like protein